MHRIYKLKIQDVYKQFFNKATVHNTFTGADPGFMEGGSFFMCARSAPTFLATPPFR